LQESFVASLSDSFVASLSESFVVSLSKCFVTSFQESVVASLSDSFIYLCREVLLCLSTEKFDAPFFGKRNPLFVGISFGFLLGNFCWIFARKIHCIIVGGKKI